jgi:allophanate hydrolase
MTDPVRARKRAAEVDQPVFISVLDDAVVAGYAEQAAGPLTGVAFAVKDNIDVAGVPTTAACPGLTEPAGTSAAAVRSLVAAGAVPIGKTNMDQFATGLVGTRSPYGVCHSVASAAHVSGGSSSGSALAVALGIVGLALGTDTAGSGRVPAAFNGLVGVKPSRGLVSTRGVLPACPSLDCVTTFTRTVAQARAAFDVLVDYDPTDPYARPMPVRLPEGVARRMRVIAVPAGPLDMDDEHAPAWQSALAHAATLARLAPVDVTPLLAAARLLYQAPFVAERLAAFGHLLDGDGVDPTVREIVLAAGRYTAEDAFRGSHELARLARAAGRVFVEADALLLPVTPGHPTIADVARDPVGVNARLGTYTNMVNLLDLCAIAVPAGNRSDGLPFGVQLIAPAFADRPLLDLAASWTGEPVGSPSVADNWSLVAVAGAHLTGQPANGQLVDLGGRLHARARTAGGYRMFRVPGPFPRPGLVHTGDGRAAGIDVEVWELPTAGVGALVSLVAPPLHLGPLALDDGTSVAGFLADSACARAEHDITEHGGWRAYLAGQGGTAC